MFIYLLTYIWTKLCRRNFTNSMTCNSSKRNLTPKNIPSWRRRLIGKYSKCVRYSVSTYFSYSLLHWLFFQLFIRVRDVFLSSFFKRWNINVVFQFVEIQYSTTDFVVSKDYFPDIMCFLTFNVCAALGNLLATVWHFVRKFLS